MTLRHGNVFRDTAALNPFRQRPALYDVQRAEAVVDDICSNCGGSYSGNEHTEACRREARALLVWNAPATDTGRSVLR